MRIGVLTVAFGEERFIGACIKQFEGFPITDHLVLASTLPWYGKELPDETADVARLFGATVIVQDWDDENEQRRFGLDYLANNDWILIVDADEYYTKRAIGKIFDTLAAAPQEHKVYESWRMETYWKSWNWAVRPMLYPPVIAVRPGVYPSNIRNFEYEKFKMPFGVTTYHLSYARTDAEILRKIKSWGHAHEVPASWYEDFWLNWGFETRDFNPTRPDIFHEIVESPIPDELKDLIDRTRSIK